MQSHRLPTRVFLVCLFALLAQAGSAQNDLRIRPIITSPSAAQPVLLEAVDVAVSTAGSEAWIRYDMVFRNPNARVLEGNLDFPLADGQQVVGFALDVNGEMRDAVSVPKAKGRAVFEAIERRGVDPGLLEQTAGNHYSLRVYPIPANGQRKVRLWVAQSLKRAGDSYQLPLVLGFAASVSRIPLSVQGGEHARLANMGRRIDWTHSENREATVLDPRDLDKEGRAILEWTASDAPSVIIQRAPQGDFVLVDLALPSAKIMPAKIRHLALIWDASLSGQNRDHDLELAALDRLLKELGDVRVSLQVLRNTTESLRVFDIRAGDSSALKSVLRALPYDGATRASAIRPVAGADRYLYVGDGVFNLGVDEVPTLPARLDAWVNGSADTPRLKSWTALHKGLVIALNGVASLSRVDEMLHSPALVERIDVPGGKDAVLESPLVDAQGRIRFAVQRQSASAVATVHWRDARGAFTTVVPLAGDVVEGRMASYAWARWRMDALEARRATHRDELQALGARFGIPNSESSLIVLETVEDYVRYDIEPPAALLPEWATAKQLREAAKGKTRQSQLDGLAKRYEERATWWRTAFPKGKAPTPKISPTHVGDRAEQMSMAPPSPPSAPVALMAPGVVSEQRAMSQASARQSRDNSDERAASAERAATNAPTQATIRIQPWQSESPAAKRLRDVPLNDLYATYLDVRLTHRDSPAFYMDAADVMRARGKPALAQRALSNLAELGIEDRHLMRLLAYRLEELKAWRAALPLLRRVLELAPEEPQSYRDLALALQATGDYQSAADAFYTVASGTWDSRFADIDLISLVELNALIAKHPTKIRVTQYDPRLLAHYPVGLRTVLSWDADNSDMDLWVTDPNGERVYYGHKRSYQGGRISNDFTGGYGPEEFVLRTPMKGTYKIEANYFGDRRQVLAGETTLMLTFSTGYGTPSQRDQQVTLRLKDKRETIAVGEFVVK